jgi:predicted nucleotidyltransferase
MTAEKFAMSGVEIAEKCGMCSHIAFGSECADIEKIKAVAVLLLDADFKKELERSRKENPEKSFASLRCDAVREKLGEEYAKILENPNDILAVEYVKAIVKKKSALVPIAVKRTVRFDEERGEFAPSSFIRRKFYEKDEKNGKYLPYNISEIKKDIFGKEKINEFTKNVHISLLRETPERLKNISELGGGLEYALICAVKNSENIGEALEKLRCKTLTNAKIRRMFLFSFFGVTKEMEKEMPEYTSVLAMSESKCAADLMRTASKEKRIIIAQKAGAVRKNKKAYEQYKFCENAEKILKLC